MRRKFLYFLTDKDGLSYYVENGVVKKSGTPTPLSVHPDGWNNKVVNFARNATYQGIFRSYSVPLRFVKDGAHILRQRLYTQGMEDVVFLIVLKLNSTTGKHESFFKGEIDFSKYSDKNNFFQTTILEGGFIKYLKAYEGTTYEIPLEGADVVDIKMDGLMLAKKFNYGIIPDGHSMYGDHALPCVVLNEEGTSFGMLSGDSTLNAISLTDEQNWIAKNVGDTPVTITLTGQIIMGTANGSGIYDFSLFLQKNTGGTAPIYSNTADVIHILPAGGIIPVNTSITLDPGEKLFILCHNGGGVDCYVYYLGGEMSATFNTKFKTTYIKAIKASALGDKLIKSMAGNDYSLQSTALSNCEIYLTCGDAIRGLSSPTPKLKTSFKNYFASFNRNLCIGMSINNNQIEIEKRSDYYKTDVVYDGGEVANAEFSVEDSVLVNNIKVGYAAQDYDDVNGREEFNNTHEYKAPLTRVSKELDLTAPYRADMYGIEFLRINLEGKTTTDSGSDNDIFMLVVELDPITNDGSYRLKRESYDSVTGLIDAKSAFNIQLSPKRILQTHGAWIRSLMWPYDGDNLTFQSTEKNGSLKTVKGSEIIEEKADVMIAELPAPYFLPISVKFETVVSENLFSLMETNKYGKFKFKYRGKPFTCWIEESSQEPADNAPQVWKGILVAENDLDSLIY
jgi:hypothetical protein